jgi:tRNA1(Val) A37 N6-methylase TrmN6
MKSKKRVSRRARSSKLEPDYPLQGSAIDLPLHRVLALSPPERSRYVRELLTALSRVIRADRMALKKRISFKREMRDLRSLLHAPTDMYLRTDDKTYKRNVLGRGSPGSTHTYWSRTQMWKMKTRFGDLSEQVLKRDRRLISKLEKLFDPTVTNKRNFRKSAESAVRTALKFLEFDKGSGTAFPPFHARYLADRYLPQDGDGIVIDPCAGWGGRLLGTLCVPRTGHVRYYGVDPEKRNQRAYEGLTRRVQIWLKGEVAGKRTAHVFSKPFEDWVLSPTAKRLYSQVDLVMTSPPYFSAENYNPKSKMQSANRYPEYELWREGFYRKLVEGAFNLLKPNGIFVLNIAVVAGAPRLERDARALAKDVGFKREEFFKLAMSVRPEGSRHVVCVEGASFKYEPVFVFRKPVIKTIACNNREERIRHGAIL